KTFEVAVRPAAQLLSVLLYPILELALSEELVDDFVLDEDLHDWSAEDVDEAELEKLWPEVVEEIHEQSGDVSTIDVCVCCEGDLTEAKLLERPYWDSDLETDDREDLLDFVRFGLAFLSLVETQHSCDLFFTNVQRLTLEREC